MNDRQGGFEKVLGEDFRREADAIDPVTAARLAAARRRAVAAAGRPRVAPWVPALAATAAGVMAVAVIWWPVRQPVLPATDAQAVEIMIGESPEMFEDDPDFYLWLDVVAVEG